MFTPLHLSPVFILPSSSMITSYRKVCPRSASRISPNPTTLLLLLFPASLSCELTQTPLTTEFCRGSNQASASLFRRNWGLQAWFIVTTQGQQTSEETWGEESGIVSAVHYPIQLWPRGPESPDTKPNTRPFVLTFLCHPAILTYKGLLPAPGNSCLEQFWRSGSVSVHSTPWGASQRDTSRRHRKTPGS